MADVIYLALIIFAWILPIVVLTIHAIKARGILDGLVGVLVMALLVFPGAAAGIFVAQVVYEWVAGPVPWYKEGIGWFFLIVGSPFGITGGCIIGFLAGMGVRWLQDRPRRAPKSRIRLIRRAESPAASAETTPGPGGLRPGTWARWRTPAVVAVAVLALAVPIIVVQALSPEADDPPKQQAASAPPTRPASDFALPESAIGPAGRLDFIDLSAYTRQSLSDDLHGNPGNHLRALRLGRIITTSSVFDVRGALIHLRGANAPDLPEKVEGIRVDGTVRRLHVLHGVGYGSGQAVRMNRVEVARYVVHYADGSILPISAHYGEDVCDWWADAGISPSPVPAKGPRAIEAWTGTNPAATRSGKRVRLFASVWRNPAPRDRVVSIDFVSAQTMCDPFLVAMTVER